MSRDRVAVLGLGASGLTAVKNLLERGFDVTGFERNDQVGGVWYSNGDTTQTSVLKTTLANTPKQTHAFTDFAFGDDIPTYPSAQDIYEYLQAYARHFDLFPHLRINTTVLRVEPTQSRWTVKLLNAGGQREELFDRVIVTTGIVNKLFKPTFPGMNDFKGRLMYSREYKGPTGFEGKRVVIVGNANTACDIAVDLANVASQVYLSHRSGFYVVNTAAVTRRRVAIGNALSKLMPGLMSSLMAKAIGRVMKSQWGKLDPQWKLLPAPPPGNALFTISDDIIPALRAGTVKSLGGVISFTKSGIVTNEAEVEADVVIMATSAYYDFTILDPMADPTNFDHPEWNAEINTNGQKFVRLYRNLLSTRYPDSLAFLQACKGNSLSVFLSSDLESSAIAAIWRGDHPIPSAYEMEAWCDKTYRRNLWRVQRHRIMQIDCEPIRQEVWLNKMTNNGVDEYLGTMNWSCKAWKWYFGNMRLYRLAMDGVYSPHVYRLFDSGDGTGRRRWEGAAEALYRANGGG